MTIHATRGELQATRIDCHTEEAREVALTWFLQVSDAASPNEEMWLHLQGGVTGYESVRLDEYNIRLLRANQWNACAGTRGRWDQLTVPMEELNRVLDAILGQTTPPELHFEPTGEGLYWQEWEIGHARELALTREEKAALYPGENPDAKWYYWCVRDVLLRNGCCIDGALSLRVLYSLMEARADLFEYVAGRIRAHEEDPCES